MSITHFLFDLDGVLLDTEPLYTQATQAVVGRFGKTYGWDLKRHMMGRDALVSSTFLVESLQIPLTPEQFLEERGPILEALLARSGAMPGARDFATAARALGIPMAIATSSARRLYDLKTARHAWFASFQAVVCGDDPRVSAKKPAPDIFLVAARELEADPSSCVVFEDSPAGAEAALRAGMRVVVMPDPALPLEDFQGAHRIVRGWAELDPGTLSGL